MPEFEALHPFFDGNGRLGRLLIPLFLCEKEILSRPMFYMSEHLEANRDAYYARLRAISSQGDWTGWVHFFLDALIKQAGVNQEKAQSILALYNRLKDEVVDMTHSQYGVRALDALFERPIFQSTSFIEQTDIPGPSARRLLRAFRDVGLLKTLVEGKGRRTGRYAFRELINIAEGAEVV